MLRITGGIWRGRSLATPPGEATRPSMDAHRSSLMNVLGPDLSGERVLDLFAGSGAFAFECLSRGAARAVLVERARAALEAIRRNVSALRPAPGTCEVVAADVHEAPLPPGPFDLVFVAPPYPHFATERPALHRLLAALPPLLAPDAVVVVQSDAGQFSGAALPGLAVAGRRRWGRTEFTLLRGAAAS